MEEINSRWMLLEELLQKRYEFVWHTTYLFVSWQFLESRGDSDHEMVSLREDPKTDKVENADTF